MARAIRLTVRQIAEKYNRHPATVRAAIRRLGLGADREGNEFLLTEKQAERVNAEIKEGRGRPKKER